jgi:peptidoglycan/LPS O-acetylase OafA/YrhL
LLFAWQGIPSLGGAVEKMAPLRTLLEFLLGMVVGSIYLHDKRALKDWRAIPLAIAIACVTIYGFVDIPDYVAFPAAFALLVTYLCVADSVVLRVMSNKVLLYLGEISYSTYMVHYLIHDMFKAIWLKPGQPIGPLQLLFCLMATLLLSVLMYHWIEVPAQRTLRTKFALDRLPVKTT